MMKFDALLDKLDANARTRCVVYSPRLNAVIATDGYALAAEKLAAETKTLPAALPWAISIDQDYTGKLEAMLTQDAKQYHTTTPLITLRVSHTRLRALLDMVAPDYPPRRDHDDDELLLQVNADVGRRPDDTKLKNGLPGGVILRGKSLGISCNNRVARLMGRDESGPTTTWLPWGSNALIDTEGEAERVAGALLRWVEHTDSAALRALLAEAVGTIERQNARIAELEAAARSDKAAHAAADIEAQCQDIDTLTS